MSLQGTDLALLSARIGVARIGAFRLGFFPEDVEGVGTVGPGEYAWQEIKPEDDGEEWHVVAAWSMCAEKCVASFTSVPNPANVGATVTFTDTTTPAAELTFWHWTFGDGAESDDQNPTHVYAHAGTYTVRLWASGPRGACSATSTVTVAALEAHFSWTKGAESATVDFDASASLGTITNYAWDFGDGNNDTGVIVPHDYAIPPNNSFTVILTITGPGGTDNVSLLLNLDFALAQSGSI